MATYARSRRRLAGRAGLATGIFLLGFVCGSVMQPKAEAQLGDVMKKAGGSGALGSVGELGTSIVEMQDHVTGLQKNIDTLKKVKSALGG
jgi:hypothetical protein